MTDDEMERAHARDSAYERDLRDAWIVLDILYRNERLSARISPYVLHLIGELKKERDHIVAVWD